MLLNLSIIRSHNGTVFTKNGTLNAVVNWNSPETIITISNKVIQKKYPICPLVANKYRMQRPLSNNKLEKERSRLSLLRGGTSRGCCLHPFFLLVVVKPPVRGHWALVIIIAEDAVFCSSVPPDSCVAVWKLSLHLCQGEGLTREC